MFHFLDASKAFDRVEYSKLIRLLMKRQLPAVVLRMLYNMYVSHVTCVNWNGVRSSVFSVFNGVISKEALLAQYCFVSILMI